MAFLDGANILHEEISDIVRYSVKKIQEFLPHILFSSGNMQLV